MYHLQETEQVGHRYIITCFFLREIVAVLSYRSISKGVISIQLNKYDSSLLVC